jgi:hypothetical protein
MAQTQEPARPAATPQDFARRNAPHSGNGAADLIGNAAQTVKNRARAVAEEQKEAGAERMDALGRAVHGAADELGREIPDAAAYVHTAAETLQDASRRLRARSVDDIVARLDRFARRQPAVAFAGCVVAGLALSRFLKSSSR